MCARRRGRSELALIVAVLLVGCLVTGAAFGVVAHGESRYAGQAVDRYADELSAAVNVAGMDLARNTGKNRYVGADV